MKIGRGDDVCYLDQKLLGIQVGRYKVKNPNQEYFERANDGTINLD